VSVCIESTRRTTTFVPPSFGGYGFGWVALTTEPSNQFSQSIYYEIEKDVPGLEIDYLDEWCNYNGNGLNAPIYICTEAYASSGYWQGVSKTLNQAQYSWYEYATMDNCPEIPGSHVASCFRLITHGRFIFLFYIFNIQSSVPTYFQAPGSTCFDSTSVGQPNAMEIPAGWSLADTAALPSLSFVGNWGADYLVSSYSSTTAYLTDCTSTSCDSPASKSQSPSSDQNGYVQINSDSSGKYWIEHGVNYATTKTFKILIRRPVSSGIPARV
jgi:hypothetical protein